MEKESVIANTSDLADIDEWQDFLVGIQNELRAERWNIPSESYRFKTTVQYLDALKDKLDVTSDYELAGILGISRGALSSYRTRRTRFDAFMVNKVADLLDIPETIVHAHTQIEKGIQPVEKTYWEQYLKRLKYRYRYFYAQAVASDLKSKTDQLETG